MTTIPPSVHGLIHDAVIEYADDDEAAWVVIDAARTRKALAELVQPLLREEAAAARRRLARRIERQVFGAPAARANPAAADHIDPAATRAAWLAQRIALPDGRYVTWGEATADDHDARADYLGKLRDGLARTIDQHRWAADAIRQAGVDCLLDLGDDVLADLAA